MHQENRAIRFSLLTAAFVAAGAGVVAAVNWLVDPLQYYRKADYPPLIQSSKRYQNPALARTYPYDTVLIGTSFSENISSGEVASTLGGKFLNLAMSGASMREQRLLLDVVLRTGRVRTVLWELNYEYLRGRPDWVSDFDGAFPHHYYDTNPLNEWLTYLLSVDTLKDSIQVLLGITGVTSWDPPPLERVQSWDWRTDRTLGTESLRKVWHHLQKRADLPEVRAMMEEMTLENMNRSFDQNALPPVKEHGEVRFIFFFPPVSVLRHVFYDELKEGTSGAIVENKRHIIKALRDLPNVEIYDFQGVDSVVTDFSQYYDLGHFSRQVERWMLSSIASGSHRATEADAGKMLEILGSKSAGDWLSEIGVTRAGEK